MPTHEIIPLTFRLKLIIIKWLNIWLSGLRGGKKLLVEATNAALNLPKQLSHPQFSP
jgi:hypothetical protein